MMLGREMDAGKDSREGRSAGSEEDVCVYRLSRVKRWLYNRRKRCPQTNLGVMVHVTRKTDVFMVRAWGGCSWEAAAAGYIMQGVASNRENNDNQIICYTSGPWRSARTWLENEAWA